MPYTTLRNFIAEAISGEHTAEEIKEILDNIEQGVGLQEHEKQTAEALEQLPATDEDDPVYQRGIAEAAKQFTLQFYPLLLSIESAGHGKMPVCPRCRTGGRDENGRQMHKLEGCGLGKLLDRMRPIWTALDVAEQAMSAARQDDPEPLASPVERALD
jgi:hypothetical protein